MGEGSEAPHKVKFPTDNNHPALAGFFCASPGPSRRLLFRSMTLRRAQKVTSPGPTRSIARPMIAVSQPK